MKNQELKQILNSPEFYELMQEYRNENIIFQQRVLNHFEAVKTFILDSINTRPTPISDDEIIKESHEVAQKTLASKESVLATLKGLTLTEVVKFGRLAWINGAKWVLLQGNPALIKKLWSLWESLAEAGELSTDKTFIENYNELKKEV